jgi:hypothetical protein
MSDRGRMWSFIGSIDEVPTDCDLHLAVVARKFLDQRQNATANRNSPYLLARMATELGHSGSKTGQHSASTGDARADQGLGGNYAGVMGTFNC